MIARFRDTSVRTRMTVSFVTMAIALVAVIGVGTFLTVRTVLTNQRVSTSTRQTVFALLFARGFEGNDTSRTERLVTFLARREDVDAMVVSGSIWYSSTLGLTPSAVPSELHTLVDRGKVGYQYTHLQGEPMLVYGGTLAPPGTALYMFYSLRDEYRVTVLVGRVLIVLGLVTVVLAAVLARRAAKGILQPLSEVSIAARRVAEGLLATRVESASADEVGVLAKSFNEMAAALEARIERDRWFVASVSHELRTPLATLSASSDVLVSRRDGLPPSAQEAIDLIVEDSNHLQHLIEQLLEISEMDSIGGNAHREVIDLRDTILAIMRQRRLRAPVDGAPLRIATNKVLFERVIGNLLDNACVHARGRNIRVSINSFDGSCEVAVSDRGPGIAATDLPRIFDRFYRGGESRSRETGGAGLGLAIALQSAHLLGGELHVSSSERDGTTFTLRLPLRALPEEAA